MSSLQDILVVGELGVGEGGQNKIYQIPQSRQAGA